MRTHRSKVLAILLTVTAALAAAAPAAGETPADVGLFLKLNHAVFREQPGESGTLLMLELRRKDGQWQRVWGMAPNFSAAFVCGAVEQATVGGDRIELAVTVDIPYDGWTQGGRGTYHVTLERTPGGDYQGGFEGTWRDTAVSGKADARRAPQRQRLGDAAPPIEPGDHPRILFRKADLPRLREKLKTPLGQAALERWTDAIGLGMRYQLLGDEEAAKKAREKVEWLMEQQDCGSKIVRGRVWGPRIEQIAVAYDLCYDAWEPGFREEVKLYLLRITRRLFYGHGSFQKEISWDLHGAMAGPIYYGPAIAGLALWGEPGAEPKKPEPVPETPPVVAPAEGYRPGDGVPVCDLVSGEMPDAWLFAGPFEPIAADVLDAVGGAEGFHPRKGAELSVNGRTQTFRPLSKDEGGGLYSHPKYTGGKLMLEFTAATNRAYNTAGCYYTVVRVNEPTVVQYDAPGAATEAYLSGRPLRKGEYVRLEKGLYPFVAIGRMGETVPWGRIMARPHFVAVSDEEARQGLANRRRIYRQRLATWQVDHRQWQQNSGADVTCLRRFELGRWVMYVIYRDMIGTGGYEHAGALHFFVGPHKFPALYRNVFGEQVSPYEDVTAFLSRKVFSHLYPGGGKVLASDLHARHGFVSGGFMGGSSDVSNQMFAGLFPVVPDEHKPAVLWAWNYSAGVTGEGDRTKVLHEQHGRGGEGPGDATAVYAFLNYPLDMKPQPPGKVMPSTWYAPDMGYCGFRSGWEGGDEFLVEAFAKAVGSRRDGGSGDAGTFRVIGLGRHWTRRDGWQHNRWNENVVMLPNDPNNDNATGRVVHTRFGEDGSGVMSVDLDDVYAGRKDGKDLYSRYRHVRLADSFRDLGIRGMRSVGVDYSGRSGAPCLLALVDTIDGGGSKTWMWQLPRAVTGEDDDSGPSIDVARERVEIDGNTFRFRQGDAVLRGVFVTPEPADVEVVLRREGTRGTHPRPTLFATGGDDFFVVVTIGRGDPPPVEIEGNGLAARVSVGRQKVAFDGEKVVFGAEEVATVEPVDEQGGGDGAAAGRESDRPAPWEATDMLLPAPRDAGPPANLDDAVYTLVLRGALGSRFEGSSPARAYLDCRDGTFVRAFGWTPTFNVSPYAADGSELERKGNRLRGRLTIATRPEPWAQDEGATYEGSYEVSAKIKDGEVTGRFEGTYGGSAMRGEVVGLVQERPDLPETQRVWLRWDRALFGGKMHANRIRGMLTFIIAGADDVRRAQMDIPRGLVKLDPDAFDVELTEAGLSGTVRGIVGNFVDSDAERGGECGLYEYTFHSDRVGNLLSGRMNYTRHEIPADHPQKDAFRSEGVGRRTGCWFIGEIGPAGTEFTARRLAPLERKPPW
jgi:hypothetical protein